MNSPVSSICWSISYRQFLGTRIRSWLLPRVELPRLARRFSFFTLSNDIISTRVRSAGAYEPEVLAIIGELAARYGLASGTALDVGANIGNHTVSMSKIFTAVVAFEPNPVMAMVLRANCLLNSCSNVQVIEVGLVERDSGAYLRQITPGNAGTLELAENPIVSDNPLVCSTVKLRRGDAVISELNTTKIALIKIDVEGAEVRALTGLHDTLRDSHPITCFESRSLVEGSAIQKLLRNHGYMHFYEIRATRAFEGIFRSLQAKQLPRKTYYLSPVNRIEDKHYSAIFASTSKLE